MDQTALLLPPDLIDALGEPSTTSFETAQAQRGGMTASSPPPTSSAPNTGGIIE